MKNSQYPLSLIVILRLVRPDAKRFVRPSLIWDLTTSASSGSLPRDFELSNYDCYGKPIRSTTDLGSLRPRTTRNASCQTRYSDSSKEESTFHGNLVSFLLLILQRYLLVYIFMIKSFHSYEVKSHCIVTNLVHKCQSVNNLCIFIAVYCILDAMGL